MRSLVATPLALALAALSAGCEGRYFYDGSPVTADAGPDQMARELFAETVAPLMVTKCDTCHKTGQLMAPVFESTYDSVTAFATMPPDPAFLNCRRPDSSLILTKGMHAGPPFDVATETPVVAAWLALWAMTSPVCAGMMVEEPTTGPKVLDTIGLNEIDLSTVGAGLNGAKLTFTLSDAGSGLLLSDMKLVAGPGGLHVVRPSFETCATPPMPTPDEGNSYSMTDVTVDADMQRTLLTRTGTPSLTLTGRDLGVPIAIRFEAITPAAGMVGPAVDNGGACAP